MIFFAEMSYCWQNLMTTGYNVKKFDIPAKNIYR